MIAHEEIVAMSAESLTKSGNLYPAPVSPACTFHFNSKNGKFKEGHDLPPFVNQF